MKIFLDTADVAEIKKWKETGLIEGVTTNPTHLSKEGGDPTKKVLEICKLLPKGAISVEVTEAEPDKLYKQAQAIAKLAPNIVVKIPCYADYYSLIHKLVKDKVPLNITLVFTVPQALYMAKLGVQYISPFVGRWDDIDVDGADLLYEIRAMLDTYHYEAQLLAASLRHVRHLHEAIMAGADVATVPIAVLAQSMDHLLTNQGMTKFNDDWKKLKVSRFP